MTKKLLSIILVLCLLFGMFSVTAYAGTEPETTSPEAGVFDITTSTAGIKYGVTVKAYKGTDDVASATPISATVTDINLNGTTRSGVSLYVGAEKFVVTCSGAAVVKNAYYLIIDQDKEALPTSSTEITYIDQKTCSTSGAIEFLVYPSEIKPGQKYSVYLTSSNDGTEDYTDKLLFSYEGYAPYKLGDVNGDGEVNIKDVTVSLRHVAEIEKITNPALLQAIDVNKSGGPDINDVTVILRYVAEIISEL